MESCRYSREQVRSNIRSSRRSGATAISSSGWALRGISPASVALPGQSAILSIAAVTHELADSLNLLHDEGVVISHDLWQNEFHSDPGVRGRQIRIDGVNIRVVGVKPDWLEGIYRDRRVDVWMQLDETAPAERGS